MRGRTEQSRSLERDELDRHVEHATHHRHLDTNRDPTPIGSGVSSSTRLRKEIESC
jgi:fatty-acid desaturase